MTNKMDSDVEFIISETNHMEMGIYNMETEVMGDDILDILRNIWTQCPWFSVDE